MDCQRMPARRPCPWKDRFAGGELLISENFRLIITHSLLMLDSQYLSYSSYC